MIPLHDDNPVKNKSYIRLVILLICTAVFFQIFSNDNNFLIYYFGFKPISLFDDISAPSFFLS